MFVRRKKIMHITTVIVSSFVVIGILGLGLAQAQSNDFKVNIFGPEGFVNQRTITLSYVVNAPGAHDKIAVKLWQNDTLIRSEFTSQDSGDSGSFAITVPSDGTYTYYYTAINGADTAKSDVKTLRVDSTPTGPAVYGGVTQRGDTYTIAVKAPTSSDVTEIRIFSSVSSNFTADASTQIGVVKVTPGQEATFTYTAPDSRHRYVAVQAFDAAGNGSDTTGDQNTVVARGATIQTYQTGSGTNGEVDGSSASERGQVNASGKSTTDINTNAADVLSDGTNKQNKAAGATDSWIAWVIIIGLVAASLGYANRAKVTTRYNRTRPTSKE